MTEPFEVLARTGTEGGELQLDAPLLVSSLWLPLASVPANETLPLEVSAATVASSASTSMAPLLVWRSSFPLPPSTSIAIGRLRDDVALDPLGMDLSVAGRQRENRLAGTLRATEAPDEPNIFGPVRVATIRTVSPSWAYSTLTFFRSFSAACGLAPDPILVTTASTLFSEVLSTLISPLNVSTTTAGLAATANERFRPFRLDQAGHDGGTARERQERQG